MKLEGLTFVFLMMMEILILSLNIRASSIMNPARNLVVKEVFINNNITTIKSEDFVHCMNLSLSKFHIQKKTSFHMTIL